LDKERIYKGDKEMKVDWYDEVRLKDGREGCVIEIYKHPDGNGYEIELSPEPNNSETVTVEIDEIEEVIRKN
jgi:hypothetical protein